VAALKTALANLERLTGQCPLAFDLRASPPGLVLPPELETALEQAKERNADFLAANAELAAAESERNKSQNSFYPKLSLDYTELQTRNTSGTESYVKDSKVALNATFSIFNGGIDRNQFNAGQARVNELLTQSGALERKLRSDLQGAYFNLYSVNKRFETVGEELQSNQKVVDAFSAQLSASNRQLLDVLDAQQRLHQSKLDLLQNVIRQAQIQLQISHWTGALKSGLLP
jgi:adhesin transport system outer membrane protein